MTMTATETFVDTLNFVAEDWGHRFEPSTPLSAVLRRDAVGPEAFLDALAGALDIEISEIDQSLIHPEVDTIESMMARFEADQAPRGA